MAHRARYDGIADWYDEVFHGNAEDEGTAGLLARRLGPGDGRTILDVACGTGLHFRAVEERDWRVVGVDLSSDQLRIAKSRSSLLALADGCHLPFPDSSFSLVVATFIHTDVDDFAGVAGEVARVLAPGGRFVYVGLHPCFVGPFVKRLEEARTRRLVFTEGYGDSRRVHDGSGFSGLNHRVGARWLPLAAVLQALIQAGLTLTDFEEFGGTILPWNIVIDATWQPGHGAMAA